MFSWQSDIVKLLETVAALFIKALIFQYIRVLLVKNRTFVFLKQMPLVAGGAIGRTFRAIAGTTDARAGRVFSKREE
jgi:hypothetical protein